MVWMLHSLSICQLKDILVATKFWHYKESCYIFLYTGSFVSMSLNFSGENAQECYY